MKRYIIRYKCRTLTSPHWSHPVRQTQRMDLPENSTVAGNTYRCTKVTYVTEFLREYLLSSMQSKCYIHKAKTAH